LNSRAYRVCLRGEQLLYPGLSYPVEIVRRHDLTGGKIRAVEPDPLPAFRAARS
jgi:hypothetical protein